MLGESKIPRIVEPQDFIVEPDRRYIVNPGSVGQPRDGSALASYCIYDTETCSVYWRRVPFDLDEYKQAVAKAGLDESVNAFLNFDPRNGAQRARDITDFSPATAECDKATQVVELKELDLLASSARKWRTSFTAVLLVMMLFLSALGTMGFLHATKELSIPAASQHEREGALLAKLAINESPTIPLSDYNLLLSNKRRQTVCIRDEDDIALLCIKSASEDSVILVSTPIPASPGQKMSFELLLRKSQDFKGSAIAFISLAKNVDGVSEKSPRHLIKEPNLPRKGGFLLGKQTFNLPANTTHVSLGLSGEFTGQIEIADLRLERKD